MPKRTRASIFAFWLGANLALSGCASNAEPDEVSTAPQFLSQPILSQNPNPEVPLAAILSFEADGADTTKLDFSDGERTWRVSLDRLPEDGAPLPILGMRADRSYDIDVSICDQDHTCTRFEETLSYRTPPLPSNLYEMPAFQVNASNPDQMEDGITIVSLRRTGGWRPQDRSPAQQNFVDGYGLLLGLDNEGEVVWYYQLKDDRMSGIERLANGNIIYHLASFETVEIDLLGNRVRSWYAENRPKGPSDKSDAIAIKGIQTLHHQPHQIGDGRFLAFSANWRIIENWYTNEFDPVPRKDQKVMGDTIIEFDEAGNVHWSWDAFDYLDTDIIGYEAFNPYWVTRGFPDTWDWTHGNGVSYDPRDDSVIASFKLVDAIIKIDRKSKDIKWILSDPALWKGELADKLLTPVGEDFVYPWHQHNPRWTADGTLLVFNNNRAQAKPFDGRKHAAFEESYSFTVEYEIDEEAGTVEQVFNSEPEMTEESCFAMAMSESHRLPETDNILEITAICGTAGATNVTQDIWDRSKLYMNQLPHWGRIREYDRSDPTNILFDVTFADPHELISWQVYGGFRTPDLYWAAGSSDDHH